MAIRVPGKRDRGGHQKSSKRDAVAVLQLTAMVDMFTVLCVFLLQNYATTNQVLPIDENVALPQAREVKELKPSNVVVISEKGIMFNSTKVAEFDAVKSQEDWMVQPLMAELAKAIEKGEQDKRSFGSKIKGAVNQKTDVNGDGSKEDIPTDEFRRVTVQADKKVDFLTVKKIMYTATEAGIIEINFAVLKAAGESQVN